jgi:hypothetical protein
MNTSGITWKNLRMAVSNDSIWSRAARLSSPLAANPSPSLLKKPSRCLTVGCITPSHFILAATPTILASPHVSIHLPSR